MGNEAEVVEEEVTKEEVEPTEDESEDETETDDSKGDGQEESGDGDPESETQSDSNDAKLSQDDVNRILSSRLNKYQGKVVKADERADKAEAELKSLREQKTLTDLALEQAKAVQSASKPNPNEFDGGVDDQAYITAHDSYTENKIKVEVSKQVAEATRHTTTAINQGTAQKELEKFQIEHVHKAAKLKIKDYEQSEDNAIEILGLDNFNYLISSVDESPLLINFLGKKANESVAREIVEVAKTNPAKAGIIIGGILSKLKAGPGKSKKIPKPDKELEGGKPPNPGAKDRKLNKLIEEASETGSIKKLRAYRKEMKAKGKI